ncbi:MAG: tyrosyl-tRNA synthetase [Spirosomataceae bacterium]
MSKSEIETLEAKHAETPHLRLVQKTIAEDVTRRVHGDGQYELAVKASQVLYGKATLETLQSLDEKTFKAIFDGVPQTTVSSADFTACESLLDLISTTTNGEIYASKGEARRALKGNAVSINKQKYQDEKLPVSEFSLLNDKYLLIGKGKKNHIVAVG